MDKEKINGIELSDKELEKVSGGDGVALLTILGSLCLTGAGGSMNCPYQGCNSTIARRALKNHLVSQHSISEEDAMNYIYANDPDLAAQQW